MEEVKGSELDTVDSQSPDARHLNEQPVEESTQPQEFDNDSAEQQGGDPAASEQASDSNNESDRSDQPETQEELDLEDGQPILIAEAVADEPHTDESSAALKAVVEAAIYITEEPLTAEQIALAIEQPLARVKEILHQLVSEYAAPDRGLTVRELAGGYKMATKPEFHEPVRKFVKNLQPPLKLSLAALETLAVIAYKQPLTGPEILDIRGVQGGGVLKTLLDRKLIATAGRKNVIGKPMMYKTTREFLIQFGLNSVAELPTLKEFEELGRMALSDDEVLDQAVEESRSDPAAPIAEPEADRLPSLESAETEETEQAGQPGQPPVSAPSSDDAGVTAEYLDVDSGEVKSEGDASDTHPPKNQTEDNSNG